MPEKFVLRPPVGWLNRVDDLLIHHGATTCHGSHLGEALANLIRSWRRDEGDPDECSGWGPEHWGPRREDVNEYGVDMTRIGVGTVLRFELPRATARVVRMDRPRLGVVEILGKDGQPTGERAIFHSANVQAILDSSPKPGGDR